MMELTILVVITLAIGVVLGYFYHALLTLPEPPVTPIRVDPPQPPPPVITPVMVAPEAPKPVATVTVEFRDQHERQVFGRATIPATTRRPQMSWRGKKFCHARNASDGTFLYREVFH